MKTTGRATLLSRVSRPPVPLELFLIVTKPVVGPSTAIICIECIACIQQPWYVYNLFRCTNIWRAAAAAAGASTSHRGKPLAMSMAITLGSPSWPSLLLDPAAGVERCAPWAHFPDIGKERAPGAR